MMKKISIAGKVDAFDLYRKLVEYYHNPVEDIIRTKLSTRTLIHPDMFEGAKEFIDKMLEQCVMKLQKLIPGAAVFWDDHVDMARTYPSYPCVVVDVVDGARNLHGGGTDVSSTLAIIDEQGNMPLAVVSYPFGVERIVDLDGDVYRIPNVVMEYSPEFARKEIEQYRLDPREEKFLIGDIRFAERYDFFDDLMRRKIDALRSKVRSYVRPVGSISQMMMKVILESCDVLLTKRQQPIDYFDFLAPAKIIRDLEGYVTDLQGNILKDDVKQVEGLIVASRVKTHKVFMDELSGC